MSKRKAFPLRIDEDLYAELRRWAESEFRSVNGQIEYLLRRAVQEKKKGKGEGSKPSTSSED